MSRRRFATATATFNHFIHGIDDQKYAVAMNGGEDETIPIVHSQYCKEQQRMHNNQRGNNSNSNRAIRIPGPTTKYYL